MVYLPSVRHIKSSLLNAVVCRPQYVKEDCRRAVLLRPPEFLEPSFMKILQGQPFGLVHSPSQCLGSILHSGC